MTTCEVKNSLENIIRVKQNSKFQIKNTNIFELWRYFSQILNPLGLKTFLTNWFLQQKNQEKENKISEKVPVFIFHFIF